MAEAVIDVSLRCPTFIACLCAVSAQAATLKLEDCRLESAATSGSVAARCGYMEVPENREQAGGKAIRLHVAVIPALRLRPARDPLVVLSGGPGQAASDFYLSISPALARIRRERDIVLVDQRGTGRSSRLDCELPDDDEFATATTQQLQGQVAACLQRMPADPRHYTTSVAVRDLEEVRAALGYPQLNLYSVSYGTRVAQHYIRRHPQRVRSVILDGAVPVDLALGPDAALDAQRALDALLERCQNDLRCRSAFPSLGAQFNALQAQLRERPVHLSLPDPMTAQPTQVAFGLPQLAAAVRLLSYTDETASVLPLLIHQAQTAQAAQALAAQYVMIKRSTDAQIAYGMHFTVICSEDAPRWDRQGVTASMLEATYMGTAFMSGMQAICDAWPAGMVDEDFNAALSTSVPALILSGENDPVTPRTYGDRVMASFARGRHLVLKGQGHGQLGNGCMPRVVAQFISAGTADALDATCLESVTGTPFMLSATAPAP